MSQVFAVWAVLVAALVGANLPFVTDRFAGFLKVEHGKSIGMRLLEMAILYGVVGAFALGLEHRAGQIASQQWQFYAITAALFTTLGFPGFVYCYLLRRRHDPR